MKLLNRFKRKKVEDTTSYTEEDVKYFASQGYEVGYTDGKRDGLAVAREQAIKTVKEITWQQNKTK